MQPPTEEDARNLDTGKNGEPSPRTAPVKPVYRPVTPDDLRQVATSKENTATTSAEEPLSGQERAPTPEITANSDAGNRDIANQSAVMKKPLVAEHSSKTASHGAPESKDYYHTNTTHRAEYKHNPSARREETEFHRLTFTPASQFYQTAVRSVA